MLTSKTEAAMISKAALDSITQHPPLLLVQGCPRGYDMNYRTGRCYPNSGSYRGPRYGEYGGYGGYRGDYYRGGYGGYGGGRCRRGYDFDYDTGRCYPNR
jgi:hypothetical protein